MADDIAVAAVSQRAITPSADAARRNPAPLNADRAERGVEIFSRWAGIIAFVGTVAALAWLIF